MSDLEPAGGAGDSPPDGQAAEVTASLATRLESVLAPELELVRPLGGGAISTVFLAREPALRRLVAIKVLHPSVARDVKVRARFEREAQSAARISHPNVVAVYRVGTIPGDLPYLVLQYVKGRSLAERLRAEGVLPVPEARQVLESVALALAAAHGRGIVHRDVKPSNILHEAETERYLLTDFGIAALLASGDQPARSITTAGHILADMRYVSPEQLRGEEVTPQSDTYSLAVLGYEILTGRGPYEVDSALELAAAHLTASPTPLRRLRPEVDRELGDLLSRCLAKAPADRPGAEHVAARAGGAAERTTAGVPAPAAASESRPRQTAGRNKATPEPLQPGTAQAAAEDRIYLRALGGVELTAPDGRSMMSVLAQPKRLALLVFLAVHSDRRYARRDSLVGLFWPESDQARARHALRQAVYVLRRALGTAAVVSRGEDEIGLSRERFACDVGLMERAARQGDSRAALDLYRGDLLPGFYLSDSPEFERWLEEERLRLRRLAAECAWSEAARAEEEGSVTAAVRWASRAVEYTPFEEGSLHRLLELLDRVGDRAGALRAYEHFSKRLSEEYAAEPSPETKELMEKVRARR